MLVPSSVGPVQLQLSPGKSYICCDFLLHLLPASPTMYIMEKVGVGNTLHSLRNSSEVALSGGFFKISRSGLAFHFGTCLS